MTRSWRTRTLAALTLGTLALASGCQRTGDPIIDALCEAFGFTLWPPGNLTLRDGDTRNLDLYFLQTDGCPTYGTFSGSSNNAAGVEFGAAFSAKIDRAMLPIGLTLQDHDDADVVRYSLPLKLNLAGTYNVNLSYENSDARATESFSFTTIATPARGTINVQISGLPAGVDADVDVGFDDEDGRNFTASGSAKFFAGNVEWEAYTVQGPDGTVYVPTVLEGTIPLAIGETKTLNVVYVAQVGGMGTLNLTLNGLFGTYTGGTVNIVGNGVNMTVGASMMVPLAVGTYIATANNASSTNNDFAAPNPVREFTISPGQVTSMLYAYAIVATLVNFNVLGLEPGLLPSIILTQGLQSVPITAMTQSMKLALGVWTIAMADRIISGRTWGRTGNSALTFTVLAQTSPMSGPVLRYFCYRWQWQILATFGIVSDPNLHAGPIGIIAAAYLLSMLWQFPDPAPAEPPPGSNIAFQHVTQETVSITGPNGFIPVSGTRTPGSGALNLTGAGTTAGIPNVPALLTGTMNGSGALTGVQYRMGHTSAPFSLPNGPITYSITAPAAPAGPPVSALFGAAPPSR